MNRSVSTLALAALFGGLLVTSACTQHKVEVEPTHHTIQVEPIQMTIDVNIRVQRELQKFFAPIEGNDGDAAPQDDGETSSDPEGES